MGIALGQLARAMTYGVEGDQGEGGHWGRAWPESGRSNEAATEHLHGVEALTATRPMPSCCWMYTCLKMIVSATNSQRMGPGREGEG